MHAAAVSVPGAEREARRAPFGDSPEALLEVHETSSTRCIHIIDTGKATAYPRGSINSLNSTPSIILILPVSRNAVSIIEALNHLRPEDIIPIADPETRTLIELRLVRGEGRSVPAKRLWADASQGLAVCVLTRVNKLQAEVFVFLLFQDDATEEVVASVEAGQVLRTVDCLGTFVSGEECQVWPRGGVGGEVCDAAVGGRNPAVGTVSNSCGRHRGVGTYRSLYSPNLLES